MHGRWIPMAGCKSIFLALLVLWLWLSSLYWFLTSPSLRYSLPLIVLAVLLRTFLQTGLFIVAHDAMHGNLVPGKAVFNTWLGVVFLGVYGLLSYDICRENHINHHQFCGQSGDPDVPLALLAKPLAWYFRFMYSYTSLGQLLGLVMIWGLSLLVLPGDWGQLLFGLACFWILPMVLSSAQLFIFGTYLPHRSASGAQENASQGPGDCLIVSTDLHEFWSLLSCYHFGYHCEHHNNPALAWHQLPLARRQNLKAATNLPLAS
ncbi:MAG: hypothetical protein RLZZ158_2155 [Cyanobacteriota bacterium]